MLTNPVAGASAFVVWWPGRTMRWPSGSFPLWPLAIGTPFGTGMSGVVSVSAAASTISRWIQTA